MAFIEIGQLPLTTSILNTTQLPVETANVTQKIEAISLKSYLSELSTLTVSGNTISANLSVTTQLNSGNIFTSNLYSTGVIHSTIASGTPPLLVTSTTQVPNLYAARAAVADATTNGLTTTSSFGNVAGDVIVSGNSSNLQFTLSNVNPNTGTFGNTVQVPQIVVNAKGRITAVANVAITFPAQTLISNTAEITANTVSGTPGLNLAATGVTAGTYGGAINIPQISVDAKGRITGVTSVPINSTLNTLNIGMPIGTIAIWSGSTGTIPDGWQVADGTNGTLDLRDKFVLGAGTVFAQGATGGSANANVVSHTHAATSVSTFAGNALGTHTHGITDTGHAHTIPLTNSGAFTNFGPIPGGNGTGAAYTQNTNSATTGISIAAQSAGTPAGVVTTTTTNSTEGVSATNANLPPYMALYYIQKISDAVSINNPINYMATVGNIIAGGNIVAASGNISANVNTGAMVVVGGLGVTGNINVGSGTGNAIVANGNVVINGALIVGGGAGGGLIPPGGIIMWSGLEVNIPVGWYLCNGTNSTPDLRNRFVIGAGTGSSYTIGDTGGSANAVVVSHSHTTTVTDPGHVHQMTRVLTDINVDATFDAVSTRATTDDAAYTDRNTDSKTTGITVAVNDAGSSATNANLPPYYALCYIMKA
jgi:hypothetical protein